MTTTLRLRGEVDISTVHTLGRALNRAMDTGLDLVVDLGDVTFIDVGGLRTLAVAADRLHVEGGRLRLAQPRPHVRRVIGLLGWPQLVFAQEPPR